ncbi:MAG: hypothetical protein MJ137_05530 [Clostridia bacterium]|nr:hypothetical protein [Clostridia bacterium]
MKIERIIDSLHGLIQDMSNINSRANSISNKMNAFFERNNDSPMNLLYAIKQSVNTSIYNTSTIAEKLKDIKNELSDIYDEASSCSSNISSVSSSIDSLGYKLDSFDDISSSIDRINDLMSSSLDQYDYNSIYQKIDELKSMIESASI